MQSTSNRLPNAIITNNELTPIEKHNSQVIAVIKRKPLSLIQQTAIKLFKDNCQREKFTSEDYNKAVDSFNKRNGLLITKIVVDTVNSSKYDTGKRYSRINYPDISPDALKLAMDNYRAETERYNLSLIEVNNVIKGYNKTVKEHLTYIDNLKRNFFITDNQRYFTKKYNKNVEIFNKRHGNIIMKLKYQEIKDQHEKLFEVLLYFYASQLKTKNRFNKKLNISTSINKNELPPLSVNYQSVLDHKRNGFKLLKVKSKKTLQNRMKRLREAGIITNYLFINSNKPVKCTISPKILVVLDGNAPKQKNAENQLFMDKRSNGLHNYKDTTCNLLLKKDKIKDSATSSKDFIRSLQKQTVNICVAHKRYKNTQKIISKNTPSEPKKYEKRSKNLRKLLVEPHILAQQLENNQFLEYTPLRYDRLELEKLYGNLTNEEFKQLVIYDFFKSSNKLYKKHNKVFAGEWTRTIQKALDTWFINRGYTLQKETTIKKLKQYRWQLEKARKFLLKPENKDFNLLYPYQYFNKSRTLSKECGFFGLEQHYIKKQTLKIQKLEAQKLETRENNLRKQRLTYLQRAENNIKKYLKGTINHQQLYNYIQDNLPYNWIDQLPSLIEKMNNKQQKVA